MTFDVPIDVIKEAAEGIDYLVAAINDGQIPCSDEFRARWVECSEAMRSLIVKVRSGN